MNVRGMSKCSELTRVSTLTAIAGFGDCILQTPLEYRLSLDLLKEFNTEEKKTSITIIKHILNIVTQYKYLDPLSYLPFYIEPLHVSESNENNNTNSKFYKELARIVKYKTIIEGIRDAYKRNLGGWLKSKGIEGKQEEFNENPEVFINKYDLDTDFIPNSYINFENACKVVQCLESVSQEYSEFSKPVRINKVCDENQTRLYIKRLLISVCKIENINPIFIRQYDNGYIDFDSGSKQHLDAYIKSCQAEKARVPKNELERFFLQYKFIVIFTRYIYPIEFSLLGNATKLAGHSNVMMYNIKERVLEVYDPQQMNPGIKKFYETEVVSVFESLFNSKVTVHFFYPFDKGFQDLQELEYGGILNEWGNCSTWTAWFTEQRLKIPAHKPDEAYKHILKTEIIPRMTPPDIQNKYGNRYLTEMIKEYSRHIHSQRDKKEPLPFDGSKSFPKKCTKWV